jgi:hypothetical protein
MASTAVNVTNPVATPTSIQLCQIADNIANVLQTGAQKGNYIDLYDAVQDLATAIRCLAQSGITVNNTTASSVGTVTVRGAYALGAAAVVPTSINTAAV